MEEVDIGHGMGEAERHGRHHPVAHTGRSGMGEAEEADGGGMGVPNSDSSSESKSGPTSTLKLLIANPNLLNPKSVDPAHQHSHSDRCQ